MHRQRYYKFSISFDCVGKSVYIFIPLNTLIFEHFQLTIEVKDLIDGQKMLNDEVIYLNREHFLMTCDVFLLVNGLIYLIDEVILPKAEVKLPELYVLR